MHLLSLNEDVLRCIFSKLHGKDALNLSLTSSHVHDLAIHRVAAVIVCKTPRDLRLAHKYMFSGSRPRVKYLERLTLYNNAFLIPDDVRYEIRPHSLGGDSVDARGSFYDWALLNLVLDLLMNAPNLHHLQIPLLYPLLERDGRFGPTLHTLHSLTSLGFDAVGDTIVTFLRNLPCATLLRKLSLRYTAHTSGLYCGKDEPTTFQTLLDTLATFLNLHTLTLAYFNPPAPLLQPEYTPPLFPVLCSLNLDHCSPDMLYLVQLCPSIQSVGTLTYNEENNLFHESTPWPPLRAFELWDTPYEFDKQSGELLQGAHYLQIMPSVSIDDPDHEEYTALIDTIRRASPVCMFLSLELGLHPVSFWPRVAQIAPNLRFLELRLNIQRLTPDYLGWLNKVPDTFRTLELVSLRILLPRLWEYYRRFRESPRATREDVAALEQDRSQSAKTLPQRLAHAIPTLRFVGVCEANPSSSEVYSETAVYDSDGESEEEDGEEEEEQVGVGEPEAVGECNPENEWGRGDFRMMGTIAYSRWWRVRPDAGDPQRRLLDEMTVAESNRVQYFLRDSTLEGIATIEDYFP